MDDAMILDNFSVEQIAREQFGLVVEPRQIVAERINVGHNLFATVFISTKGQVFCLIAGLGRFTLGEVQKIVGRMGLRAETYLPPRGQPDYFDVVGEMQFRQVFPGRHEVSADDLRYYRTRAPYMPALVLVREVKDGTIYCADSDARTGWRPAAKLAYRRVPTRA